MEVNNNLLRVTKILFFTLFLLLNWGSTQAKGQSSQTVTAIFQNTTLNEVIWELKKLTGFTFVYNTNDVQVVEIKHLEFNKSSIKDVLDTCLKNTNLTYQMSEDVVVIKKAVRVEKTVKAVSQSYTIKGVIVDEKDESIIGATIFVKDRKTGTISEVDGSFSLQVNTPRVTLLISYVGYVKQELIVDATSSTPLKIILKIDNTSLEDVVVVGYGTQKKVTLTGSTTSTSGSALQQSSSVNLSQGLAGRLSGVIVNNRSGEPGADDAVMYIRGRSSLGDNSPLIIIDGIAGRADEFSRLTGDEIENVTVLKDASAAIYGSRSANGVILVTTKRGQKNTKPNIEFSYDLGLQQPTRLPKMADAVLYANAVNASNAIDNESPRFTEEDIQKYRDGSDPILFPNTDWYDAIIKPLSAQHKYGFSARGGSDRMTYYVSLNGQFQDGIYRESATNYKQFSVRSNIDFNITKWLKVGMDLSAREQHKNYSAFPSDDYGIFYVTMRAKPTGAAYFPDGKPRGGLNPALMVQDRTGYDKTKITTINTTFSANLNFDQWVRGLSFDGHFAYDKNHSFKKNWKTPWTYYSYDEVTEAFEEKMSVYWPSPSLDEYYNEWNRLTINAIMNYNRVFLQNHNVSLMLGFEQSEYRLDKFNASRSKYISDAIDEMFAGDANQNYWGTGGSANETARRSLFGRLNYDFKSKYMASFIARYDGSENFPKGKRWGFFPGVSAGWRISEEKFIYDNYGSWLTNLKLRASYGEQGNDNISPFQYLTTYSYSTSTSYLTNHVTQLDGSDANIVIPGTTPNYDVTWEVAKTWNVGLDGDIKNSLFSWEFEIFKTKRSNILCTRNASIPAYSGLNKLPDENIGIVENKGMELQLSHIKRVNKDFMYSVKGNLLYAKNKIIYMDETPWGDGYDYLKLEGRPMGSGLYYHVIGINKTQEDLKNYPQTPGATLGSFIYEDIDGNGKIDSYDRRRSDLTTVPQIVFGLNISAEWKNFDFMMLLQGQARAKFYYAPQIDWRSSNLDKEAAEKAWTLENPSSDYPRISTRYGSADFYHTNASFLRLKNLEIGYTLPGKLLSGVGVSKARIYIGGYNLLTFDKLRTVDPETSDTDVQKYPQMRIFNSGIKLTF